MGKIPKNGRTATALSPVPNRTCPLDRVSLLICPLTWAPLPLDTTVGVGRAAIPLSATSSAGNDRSRTYDSLLFSQLPASTFAFHVVKLRTGSVDEAGLIILEPSIPMTSCTFSGRVLCVRGYSGRLALDDEDATGKGDGNLVRKKAGGPSAQADGGNRGLRPRGKLDRSFWKPVIAGRSRFSTRDGVRRDGVDVGEGGNDTGERNTETAVSSENRDPADPPLIDSLKKTPLTRSTEGESFVQAGTSAPSVSNHVEAGLFLNATYQDMCQISGAKHATCNIDDDDDEDDSNVPSVDRQYHPAGERHGQSAIPSALHHLPVHARRGIDRYRPCRPASNPFLRLQHQQWLSS